MNIVCFGDSITNARPYAEGDRWPTILQVKLDAWKPGAFKVFNQGLGGNTTAQGFDRIATDVLPHMPGLTLIEYGFNDANVRDWARVARVGLGEFERNLREFHRAVKAAKGRCVYIANHLVTGGPKQGNGKAYMANFKPYQACIRAVAAGLRAPLIDLPAMMKARKVDLKAFLNPNDGLHLSAQGNHVYAEMVFDALRGQKLVK